MKKQILSTIAVTLVVMVVSVAAQAKTQIQCSTKDGSVSITATVESASQLSQIVLVDIKDRDAQVRKFDAITARSNPSELSPQEGSRFYFHAGNTADFLIMDSAALSTILSPKTTSIQAQRISEGYEDGGYQDIQNLDCTVI